MGLFDGTPLQRPVTCERCETPIAECACPRDAAGDLKLPKDQQVRVRREKRRGKWTTVVVGLDPHANDLAKLVAGFKTKLGVGGTATDDGFELQGDQRDGVLAALKHQGFAAKRQGG